MENLVLVLMSQWPENHNRDDGLVWWEKCGHCQRERSRRGKKRSNGIEFCGSSKHLNGFWGLKRKGSVMSCWIQRAQWEQLISFHERMKVDMSTDCFEGKKQNEKKNLELIASENFKESCGRLTQKCIKESFKKLLKRKLKKFENLRKFSLRRYKQI